MTAAGRLAYVRTAALGAALAVLLAACSGTTTAPATSGGGTVTFAEAPSSPPNYIFPMTSGAYFSYANLPDLSEILYQPLYVFGQQGQPVLNRTLSLAYPPVFSSHNTVVTVTLKHWVWSNGAPITGRDVVFWMNLLSAVTDPNAPAVGSSSSPGPGWGGAVPGAFPQNVVSYHQVGTYSVVFHLNASYNPTWFGYNELSQISPMPQASWDRLSRTGAVGNYDASAAARTALPKTSPAQYVPANPGTATSGALGVAQFLNMQSQAVSTYDSNPLWQVVDGPFRVSQFTTSGYVKMVPNRAYSGSPKPTIAAFVEVPFTTDTAEFNSLRSGNLTIGYIPVQDLGQRSLLEKQQGYRYSPWYAFGFVYFPYNFTNTKVGPIFKQLYFRQAFQSLVNQPQYIKDFMAGIGTPTNGPVPTFPAHNADVSPLEAKGQVYPYDPSHAVALLSANGWTVKPGGVSVCARPGSGAGECGPGIAANQPATFTMLYASGSTVLSNELQALQSTLKAQAGITLGLSQTSSAQVTSTAFNGCSATTPCNNWQLADWGGPGWTYLLDYLPTGGNLFATGAGSNAGDFSSPAADAAILATHTAPTYAAEIAALFKYENLMATQLPVVWMPNGPGQLTMYKSTLSGLVPQGIFNELYPQLYRLGK
ncbi:MAG TPA: ABC transporter substrate-binding protein [Candidatus Nanopelagicaceae bacterium]|nr:ABC transporter substrate-binding protein [Candidatus Nanopelagicaceae bacterium]